MSEAGPAGHGHPQVHASLQRSDVLRAVAEVPRLTGQDSVAVAEVPGSPGRNLCYMSHAASAAGASYAQ